MNINKRVFKNIILGSAAISALSPTLISCKKNVEEKPNIIFVFPDQMRGRAMGFLGQEPVITPNLDNFANESIVLTEAVCNYPISSPYRAMMLTGKYPLSNKVISNCNSKSGAFGVELQETDTCWSDLLKENGYDTGYIGKWHLDSPYKPYVKCYNNNENMAWNEWCPPERRHGFDFWYAYGTYDQHNNPMYWTTDASRDEAVWVNQWGPEHEADIAINYIKNTDDKFRDPDKPFALVVSMNPPHMPYNQVPQNYVDLYKDKTYEDLYDRPNVDLEGDHPMSKYARKNIKNYLAMITGVDDQFGRILKALEEAGLEKNTIVVFTSDHGNCLGIHQEISKNNHYEESMRIPLMIRWPEKIKARYDDLLISVPDMFPTLLNLVGLSDKIPETVEGVSFADLLKTGDGERPGSQLYLKIPFDNQGENKRGVRTLRYTLMIEKQIDNEKKYVLFDNKYDPFQLNNIAEENEDIVQQLIKNELLAWLVKTNDNWLE
ncbi:sulfatase [Bacteroidota bacterium]